MSYHSPPLTGLSSLKEDPKARALILLGSASNTNENLKWHRELVDLTMERLNRGIPILGICFSHQLIAEAFGFRVERNESGKKHVGVKEVKIHANPWGISKEKLTLFKAHEYEVKSNFKEADMNCLKSFASSDECLYEGFYHETLPFLSVQGHPEGSLDFYHHEIEPEINLSSESLELAQKDGLYLISCFIKRALSIN